MKKTYTINDLSDPKKRAEFKQHIAEINELNEWKTKPMEEKFKPLVEYVEKNFINRHPQSFSLDELHKLKADFAQWQLKKIDSDFKNHLTEAIKAIDARIERLKNQPLGEPEAGKQVKLPKNNFDYVDIKEVYQYFKANLVDKKHLSEPDLMRYLKAAFELQKPPKNKFRLDFRTKKKIQKVFYEYYKDVAAKPHGEAESYLNLLKGYFVGFENLSTSNFSKTY